MKQIYQDILWKLQIQNFHRTIVITGTNENPEYIDINYKDRGSVVVLPGLGLSYFPSYLMYQFQTIFPGMILYAQAWFHPKSLYVIQQNREMPQLLHFSLLIRSTYLFRVRSCLKCIGNRAGQLRNRSIACISLHYMLLLICKIQL